MDIAKLNGFSATLLYDLESVFMAADVYQLPDLCDSIEKYLNHLLNEQNFGRRFINSNDEVKFIKLQRDWASRLLKNLSLHPGYPAPTSLIVMICR
jgi:hypothetical protein